MAARSSACAKRNSVFIAYKRRLPYRSDCATEFHLPGKPFFEQPHRAQIRIAFAAEEIILAGAFDACIEREREFVEPVQTLQMQYGCDCDAAMTARGLQRHEEVSEHESVL